MLLVFAGTLVLWTRRNASWGNAMLMIGTILLAGAFPAIIAALVVIASLTGA